MAEPERIVDVVFQPRTPRGRRPLSLAVAFALGVHGAAASGAWLIGVLLHPSSVPLPARDHRDLEREAIVDLDDVPLPPAAPPAAPPPDEPPPAAPPPRPVAPSSPRPATLPRAAQAPAAPPPPAQAGDVVAQETDPNAPADLTGDTIVTGQGAAYAGGVTRSDGTRTRAVSPSEAAPPSDQPPAAPGPDRSSKVALLSEDWSCAWPRAAGSELIDEQVVVLRAVVRPDGHAESVTIVEDPGFGFGAQARECALRTRFQPARDVAGKPIRAQSPPIRVRFTR